MSEEFEIVNESTLPTSAVRTRRRHIKSVILPSLRQVLGPECALPTSIILRDSWERVDLGDTKGSVHVEREETPDGVFVTQVGPVVVSATLPVGDVFDRIVSHEFGHFHECEVRRARRIPVPDRGCDLAWTEYFAERTRFRAGFRHLGGIGQATDGAVAQRLDDGTLDLWDQVYCDCLLLAVLQEERPVLPPDATRAKALLRSPIAAPLMWMYRTFPNWNPEHVKQLLAALDEYRTAAGITEPE